MGGLQTPVSRAMLRCMITRLTFNEAPTIAFGGASFGTVGSYEKIQGRAFGELDPASSLNAVITDIALAPRNARGMVEYAVDFYILEIEKRCFRSWIKSGLYSQCRKEQE